MGKPLLPADYSLLFARMVYVFNEEADAIRQATKNAISGIKLLQVDASARSASKLITFHLKSTVTTTVVATRSPAPHTIREKVFPFMAKFNHFPFLSIFLKEIEITQFENYNNTILTIH